MELLDTSKYKGFDIEVYEQRGCNPSLAYRGFKVRNAKGETVGENMLMTGSAEGALALAQWVTDGLIEAGERSY